MDDHEFILGVTRKSKGLAPLIAEAEAKGASGAEIDTLEREWTDANKMCTFNQGRFLPSSTGITAIDAVMNYEAVEQAINASALNDKSGAYKTYLSAVEGKSNNEARDIARDILGESVFWDCDRRFLLHCISASHNNIISVFP